MPKQTYNIAFEYLEKARHYDDRPALYIGAKTYSHRQLHTLVVNLALRFYQHGVRRNSGIAIDTKDPAVILMSILATGLLGARWLRGTAQCLARNDLGLTHVVCTETQTYPEGLGILLVKDGWFQRPDAARDKTRLNFPGYASEDDLFAVMESSGTTGQPKFMGISYRQASERLFRPDTDAPPPVYVGFFNGRTSTGYRWRIVALMAGGAVVEPKTPEVWEKAGVTMVHGSPAHFSNWIRSGLPLPTRKIPLARLGGAKAAQGMIDTLHQYFDTVRVGFGSTETGTIVNRILHPGDQHDGSLGTARDGAKIEVVGEDGTPLPAGAQGLLRLQTPSMLTGYIGNPQASAKAFRDGWFYPGDIAILSKEGELTVLGRDNDQISLGGAKINALTIDDVVLKVPGVVDAICFEAPDHLGVNELGLAVQIEPDQSKPAIAGAIRKACRRELGKYTVPKHLYFTGKVPRNENGKPLRPAALKGLLKRLTSKDGLSS